MSDNDGRPAQVLQVGGERMVAGRSYDGGMRGKTTVKTPSSKSYPIDSAWDYRNTLWSAIINDAAALRVTHWNSRWELEGSTKRTSLPFTKDVVLIRAKGSGYLARDRQTISGHFDGDLVP